REALSRQRLFGVALPDADEIRRLAVGERAQQDRVGDAEDGGRGACAEPECRDRDGGKGRRAPELAPGESDVAADTDPTAAARADGRPRFGEPGARGGNDGERRLRER